ncbi:hypothetical protein ON010_g11281 [Phytophthora cinnamomi]|nr:hypothetical protein ON010_g11281 [Phytophthora cinnamomi]
MKPARLEQDSLRTSSCPVKQSNQKTSGKLATEGRPSTIDLSMQQSPIDQAAVRHLDACILQAVEVIGGNFDHPDAIRAFLSMVAIAHGTIVIFAAVVARSGGRCLRGRHRGLDDLAERGAGLHRCARLLFADRNGGHRSGRAAATLLLLHNIAARAELVQFRFVQSQQLEVPSSALDRQEDEEPDTNHAHGDPDVRNDRLIGAGAAARINGLDDRAQRLADARAVLARADRVGRSGVARRADRVVAAAVRRRRAVRNRLGALGLARQALDVELACLDGQPQLGVRSPYPTCML